ncbi:predicted protein [Histoplasma mississippiense (nom. inval.)]|uniref:predicted protein n=1 Tax=Ajellomyces capsulatus (strain NAm1 / WU24) TaxID=2059318 RepID=UPI000157C626|nr:predicted protein [Histoplasma mississippiense (nom. inval.)]EDN08328.1 predicted protein [Histoplasma mississippiense (nom. inval.)]
MVNTLDIYTRGCGGVARPHSGRGHPTHHLYTAIASRSIVENHSPQFPGLGVPHDRIPDNWGPISVFPEATGLRCGITNFSICTEAHLVPKKCSGTQIDMGCTDMVETCEILIIQRISFHLDRIFINASTNGVQYLENDSRPYLFARFAWAILLSVKPFVTNGEPLNVIRLEVSTGVEETQKVWKAGFLSGAQLKANYSGGGSKSATSKKRKSEFSTLEEEDEDLAESSDDSDIGKESDIWDDVMDEWEARGQRRRQQTSSETARAITSEDATAHLKSGPSELQTSRPLQPFQHLPLFLSYGPGERHGILVSKDKTGKFVSQSGYTSTGTMVLDRPKAASKPGRRLKV